MDAWSASAVAQLSVPHVKKNRYNAEQNAVDGDRSILQITDQAEREDE